MSRQKRRRVFSFSGLVLLALPACGMSVEMFSTVDSRAPVGTVVGLSGSVDHAETGTIWYRYRVRPPDAAGYRTIRDYSPDNSFSWAPGLTEGLYEVELAARNLDTGETVLSTSTYRLTSRVSGDAPVITPTSNSLVFLYSAPACPVGSKLRVQFDAPDGSRQFTPYQDCVEDRSVNVYLAGLRADTDYSVRQTIRAADGTTADGPQLSLHSGPLPSSPALTTALQKPAGRIPQGILLQSKVFEYSLATDIDGNVIWYCTSDIRYLTRPEPGGYFFALIENDAADDSDQLLRQIDLAGNVVLETNAGSINQQLVAMGKHPITGFHHEARRITNGRILVLAGQERILTDLQGPGDVPVIGDTILVLNSNLQVEWVWDAFEHLDISRKAVLGEICVAGGGGCPRFVLALQEEDWLHGNSLQLTPDGNILYSARHQDFVYKIDYANGQGSGNVIWRLGKDGDFRMTADGPWPWFSHQHDPNFEKSDAGDRMVVFDNGNTRYAENDEEHSRGQVLQIDEANRTANLALNLDLRSYSMALGSAQKLTNGNYHFDVGWMPNGHSQALEFDEKGNLVAQVETSTQQYRSFRMRDLYTPQ